MKIGKDFIVASGNQHKVSELNELLSALILTPAPESLLVDETGDTFYENALIKAEAYYQKFSRPVIADDSGLVVAALPGELGIHSARFGGAGLSDLERCDLLLNKMQDKEDRSAYFVCVLCVYLSPKEVYSFEGRVSGSIGKNLLGKDGFGYDPLFYPDKNRPKSFAEDPEWKRENSHRAIACGQLRKFFELS